MKRKILSILTVVSIISTFLSYYSPVRFINAESIEIKLINPSFEDAGTFNTGNSDTGWKCFNSNPSPERIRPQDIDEDYKLIYGIEGAYDGEYVAMLYENKFINQNVVVEENSTYELTFYHTKTQNVINITAAAYYANGSWSLNEYDSGYEHLSAFNSLERCSYSMDLGNGWYKRVVRFKTGAGLNKVVIFSRGTKGLGLYDSYLVDNFKMEKVEPAEETGLLSDPSFESSFIKDKGVKETDRGWISTDSNNTRMMCFSAVEEGQLGGLKVPDGERVIRADVSYDNVLLSNKFDTEVGVHYKLSFYSSQQLRNKMKSPNQYMGLVESGCRNLDNNGNLCSTSLCSWKYGTKHSGTTRRYDNDAGNDVALQCVPMSGELQGWYQYTVYFKALEPVSQFYLPLIKNTELTEEERYLYLDDFKLEQISEIPSNKRIPNSSFEEPLLTNGANAMFRWDKAGSFDVKDAQGLNAAESLNVPDGNYVFHVSSSNYPFLNSADLVRVKPGASYRLTYYGSQRIDTGYNHATDYNLSNTGYLSVSPYSNKGLSGNVNYPDGGSPDERNLIDMSKSQEALEGELSGWYLNTVEFTLPEQYPDGVAKAGEAITTESLVISGKGITGYIDNLQLAELRDTPSEELTFVPGVDLINNAEPITVTIDGIPENTSVYYTDNGDVPETVLGGSTKLYNQETGILVNYGESKRIKAILAGEGVVYLPHIEYTSSEYSVIPQMEAPVLPNSIVNSDTPIQITLAAIDGGRIYYTTDGTIPTTASNLYIDGTPITLSHGYKGTVKAIAVSDNGSKANSIIAEEFYSVKHINAAPVLPDISGWQDSPITITIPEIPDADVYYTTNGDTPEKNAKMKYTKEFVLPYGFDNVVKAIAITDDGSGIDSLITEKAYSVKNKTAAPQLPAPQAGKADAPITISIPAIPDATIYYTIDGSDPSGGGTAVEYVQEFVLPYGFSNSVKAMAIPADLSRNVKSDIVVVNYSVKSKTADPVLPDAALNYDVPIRIEIPAIEGAKIFYTTNGDTPGIDSQEYSEAFILDHGYSGTVKAIAVPEDIDNYVSSNIVETMYSVKPKEGKVRFEPEGGMIVVPSSQKGIIRLSDIPEGASAYYAVYNSKPNDGHIENNWILYDGGIALDPGVYYINALIRRENSLDGEIVGYLFNILNQGLLDKIEDAKYQLKLEFSAYIKTKYSEENWAKIVQIKEEALTDLEFCANEKEITSVLNNALASMAAVSRLDGGNELVKPKSVKLNKTKLKLKVKKSFKLKATIKPKKITSGWNGLTWSTNKAKIAKVNKKGKVTACKKGKAVIMVKTKNNKKAKCVVIVRKK